MFLSALTASQYSRLNKTKAASATNTRGFFVQLQRKEQVAYEYFQFDLGAFMSNSDLPLYGQVFAYGIGLAGLGFGCR